MSDSRKQELGIGPVEVRAVGAGAALAWEVEILKAALITERHWREAEGKKQGRRRMWLWGDLLSRD